MARAHLMTVLMGLAAASLATAVMAQSSPPPGGRLSLDEMVARGDSQAQAAGLEPLVQSVHGQDVAIRFSEASEWGASYVVELARRGDGPPLARIARLPGWGAPNTIVGAIKEADWAVVLDAIRRKEAVPLNERWSMCNGATAFIVADERGPRMPGFNGDRCASGQADLYLPLIEVAARSLTDCPKAIEGPPGETRLVNCLRLKGDKRVAGEVASLADPQQALSTWPLSGASLVRKALPAAGADATISFDLFDAVSSHEVRGIGRVDYKLVTDANGRPVAETPYISTPTNRAQVTVTWSRVRGGWRITDVDLGAFQRHDGPF